MSGPESGEVCTSTFNGGAGAAGCPKLPATGTDVARAGAGLPRGGRYARTGNSTPLERRV